MSSEVDASSIYQSVAKTFMDCNLELGGKDGAYVASDADVKEAAGGLVDGSMYNAGQSCCGIERAYVDESVYDEFLDANLSEVENFLFVYPKENIIL